MDFSQVKTWMIPEGEVASVSINGTVVWQAESEETDDFITFSSDSPFTLGFLYAEIYENRGGWNSNGTLQYSTDANTWTNIDKTATPTISSVNNKIYLRGDNITSFNSTSFVLRGTDISCTGDIRTLRGYRSNGSGTYPDPGQYTYKQLFHRCEQLIHAPSLKKECIGLYGCESMFAYCYKLAEAPELPEGDGTIDGGYSHMFESCISLTVAPALPYTFLSTQCYAFMFSGCTNLTTIPALRTRRLQTNCYWGMFFNCTSLKFSETQTEECPNEYSIPTNKNHTYLPSKWCTNMFAGTSGTYTDDPVVDTAYYTNATVI